MRVFGSHVNQGADSLPVAPHGGEEGLWGIDAGEAANLEERCQGGGGVFTTKILQWSAMGAGRSH